MKPEGRFVFEYNIRFASGDGGPVRERSYDYEGVVCDFIGRLTQTSPTFFEGYKITDLKTGKEYKDISKFIEAGFNEKNPERPNEMINGMVSLCNREIYHAAVKLAAKNAEEAKKLYADRFKYNFSML